MRRCLRFPLLPVLLGVACLLPGIVSGEVTLPAIFSDHAVLQRSARTVVWGKAAPEERVSVTLGDAHGESLADSAGNWKIPLDLTRCGDGPFSLQVQGTNTIVRQDILVGEVWLGSGQSNMAFALSRSLGAAEAIAASANPRLRAFQIEPQAAASPAADVRGSWVVASPATSGKFSAVGYYFAQELQRKLNVPVGILIAAWGGTHVIAWISDAGAPDDAEVRALRQASVRAEAAYPEAIAAYRAAIGPWEIANGREDRTFDPAAFASPPAGESDWQKVALASNNTPFRTLGLPDAGAIWLRRHVILPALPAGSFVSIDPGRPRDFVKLYWNGSEFGGNDEKTVTGRNDGTRYRVPETLFKEGDNVLALRIFTPTGDAGFSAMPFIDIRSTRALLDKDWLAKAEFALPPLTAAARRDLPALPDRPAPHNVAGALYNGMISPLIPVTLAGVVWYQGEQDVGLSGALYFKLLKGLIGDWRARWGADLPFVVCQLPNYGAKSASLQESPWAAIRHAQAESRQLPKVAVPVLIDLGEQDIHPPNKKPVGERVALAALGVVYGKPLVCSGPTFRTLEKRDKSLAIHFDHADGGLVAQPLPDTFRPTAMKPETRPLVRNSPGSPLEGFAVRGESGGWAWADARIDGDAVVVSAPGVAHPVAVRYAWSNNPTCNLANAEGLPAEPFEASLEVK